MSKTKEFIYTEEVTGEIINIPIDLLHHHHLNPRKDFGDLSELSDSIKKNGVFQNLTVVPFWFEITGVGCDDLGQQADMGYLVVIGNRRLEAAKLAGLETLPCIISNMSHKEQVSTMLVENMQRSDLTVYEQANGFQMMLDLGESISDISEKSGFSESTIRRRIKLTELDADKLKEACAKQVSMADFEKLNQINDIKIRNKVLDSIGTNNFDFEVNKAIKSEEEEKTKENCRVILNALGLKEIKYSELYNDNYGYTSLDYYLTQSTITPEFDIKDAQIFAFGTYGSVHFRKIKTEEEKNAGKENTERQIKERETHDINRKQLEELESNIYKCRKDFVDNLSVSVIKKNLNHIIASYIYSQSLNSYQADSEDFIIQFNLANEDEDENLNYSYEDVLTIVNKSPEQALFKALILSFGDNEKNNYRNYWSYSNRYAENEDLDRYYDLLVKLGYSLSNEEAQYKNGTHELFEKE